MDKSTLESKSNYLINNAPVGSNVSVSPSADGKSVTLIVNRTSPDGQLDFTGEDANATLKVLNLKDTAGNLVDEFNTDLPVSEYSAQTSIISDVQLVAKNRIKVVPTANNVISAVDLNDITVEDSNSNTVYAQATRVVSCNSDGSVTIELSRALTADRLAAVAIGENIAVGDALQVEFRDNAVTNAQGQTQTLVSGVFVDDTITDRVRASYVKADTDNDGFIDVNECK